MAPHSHGLRPGRSPGASWAEALPRTKLNLEGKPPGAATGPSLRPVLADGEPPRWAQPGEGALGAMHMARPSLRSPPHSGNSASPDLIPGTVVAPRTAIMSHPQSRGGGAEGLRTPPPTCQGLPPRQSCGRFLKQRSKTCEKWGRRAPQCKGSLGLCTCVYPCNQATRVLKPPRPFALDAAAWSPTWQGISGSRIHPSIHSRSVIWSFRALLTRLPGCE